LKPTLRKQKRKWELWGGAWVILSEETAW